MHKKTSPTEATLLWDDKGYPSSAIFDDIYFANDQGLEESRYVFLQNNRLAERFVGLSEGDHFTVGETGFGTGLNFLACWQLWQQAAPQGARLTYLSTEKYPLTVPELKQALSLWPELADLSEQLLQQYIYSYHGQHTDSSWYFDFGGVRLLLLIGDATNSLRQLLACEHKDYQRPQWQKVNAWFLDGFAPAKNPDLWSLELFSIISALSENNSTFATFTAAGAVRRHLEQVGFSIEKVPGFGRKREMLRGTYRDKQSSEVSSEISRPEIKFKKLQTPWMLIDSYQPAKPSQTVAVIGGGLAGCHTAYALAKRGLNVTVIERHPQLASEASGNPQGIVYAKLSYHPANLAELNLQGLCYAQSLYQTFWESQPESGEACGVLQLDSDNGEKHRMLFDYFKDTAWLHYYSAQEASERAGVRLTRGGLFFPFCGWINPRSLCQWLLKQKNMTQQTHTKVNSIAWQGQYWQLQGHNHTQDNKQDWQESFDYVVVASANDAAALMGDWLPVKPIRGQLSYLPQSEKLNLKTVICGEGYLAPSTPFTEMEGNHYHTLGASFNLKEMTSELRPQDHNENRQLLQPYLQDDILPEAENGRVAFRCASPDYLPLAGPVPDVEQFYKSYRDLNRDAKQVIAAKGTYQPNFYLSIGHGSRGLVYAPIAAELIASQITGILPPVKQPLINALNPARFIIRQLIRNYK